LIQTTQIRGKIVIKQSPIKHMKTTRILSKLSQTLLAVTACGILSFQAQAATQTWVAGNTGTFTDSTQYNAGVGPAPSAGDTVVADGAGSPSVIDYSSTISLVTLNLNPNAGSTIFNHNSGDLTLTTSLLFGGAGGSRNPTYNLHGGVYLGQRLSGQFQCTRRRGYSYGFGDFHWHGQRSGGNNDGIFGLIYA
jgi:hypothetical protein